MPNPVDEYLDYAEGQTKTAQGFLRRVAKRTFEPEGLAASAAQGGLLMGGMALAGAVGKAFGAMTKARDFKAMLDANPDLTDYRRTSEEQRQFDLHYNALRRLNPEFAAEPVVAGSYMRQMSMNPQVAGKVVVESIGGRPPSPSHAISFGPQGASYQQKY